MQPDSQANVNICGFRHNLHDFKEGTTDITGIANAKSSGQGVIMFSVKTTAGTTAVKVFIHGGFQRTASVNRSTGHRRNAVFFSTEMPR